MHAPLTRAEGTHSAHTAVESCGEGRVHDDVLEDDEQVLLRLVPAQVLHNIHMVQLLQQVYLRLRDEEKQKREREREEKGRRRTEWKCWHRAKSGDERWVVRGGRRTMIDLSTSLGMPWRLICLMATKSPFSTKHNLIEKSMLQNIRIEKTGGNKNQI